MRLIDADAMKENIQSCDRYVLSPVITSVLLHMIGNQPTVEAEPVKQDTELSIILQDYGIKDADTLRYILDQYQKIIVDITGGQMSYLTYPAETVIACADDNYRKCHEESMKHGRWETWGYVFHGIAWKRCSVCGKTADVSYQALLDGKIEMATPSICGCCGCRMDGDSEEE